MTSPPPRGHARGSGRRERGRWLMGAAVLFLLSTVALVYWGFGLVWGHVPNTSDDISAEDRAFAATMRDRLVAEPGTPLRLDGLTDFAWDTVCLMEPFDLDEAALRAAMHAGGLGDRPVRLPGGPRPIAEPNWVLTYLLNGEVVRTAEFHHREIELQHGALCVPKERARFRIVRQLGHALKIDLVPAEG